MKLVSGIQQCPNSLGQQGIQTNGNPKGKQPWILTGRTDAEAPVLWPPDVKSQLIGKDPDAGQDWEQEERGAAEDEMAGWYHWLNGHESAQTPWQWRTGKPGTLQSMGLQRVGHNLTNEQWLNICIQDERITTLSLIIIHLRLPQWLSW